MHPGKDAENTIWFISYHQHIASLDLLLKRFENLLKENPFLIELLNRIEEMSLSLENGSLPLSDYKVVLSQYNAAKSSQSFPWILGKVRKKFPFAAVVSYQNEQNNSENDVELLEKFLKMLPNNEIKSKLMDDFHNVKLKVNNGLFSLKTLKTKDYLGSLKNFLEPAQKYELCKHCDIFKKVCGEEISKCIAANINDNKSFTADFVSAAYNRCKLLLEPFFQCTDMRVKDIDLVLRISPVKQNICALAEKFPTHWIKDIMKMWLSSYDEAESCKNHSVILQNILNIFSVQNVQANESNMLKALIKFDPLVSEMLISELHTIVDIFQTLVPFGNDQWEILCVLSECSSIIYFLKTIKDADVTFMTDAVEEHSEQYVNETTVADFIQIKQFLQPVIIGQQSNLEHFLSNLNKCFSIDVKNVIGKLENCNGSCSNLEALYKTVSDKGEGTKQVIREILTNGTFEVKLINEDVYAFIHYETGKHKTSLSRDHFWLNDIKSRARILSPKGERSDNVVGSILIRQQDIDSFVKLVDLINIIVENLDKLRQQAHFSYRNISITLTANDLNQYATNLDSEVEKWKEILAEERKKHPILNFLYSKQIWTIYDIIVSEKLNISGKAILKFINGVNEIDNNCFKTLNKYYTDDQNCLVAVATFLENVGSESMSKRIFLNDDIRETGALTTTVTRGNVYIGVLVPESTNTVSVIVNLYLNTTGTLPMPSELLICEPDTSLDEIQLFVNRCISSTDKKVLYCISGLENLDDQYEVTALIHNLQHRASQQDCTSNFLLAVILRASSSHPLQQQMPLNIHPCNILSNETLKHIVNNLPTTVFVATSDLPGQGKSELIKWKAQLKGKSVITVPIYRKDTKYDLIHRLFDSNIKHYHCLHLDVKCPWSSFLDAILLELVLIGCLHNSVEIFHLPTSMVAIELQNDVNDYNINGYAVNSIERHHIMWQNYEDLVVSLEPWSDIQVVCKYFMLLDKGTLDAEEVQQNTVIKREDCLKLLQNAFNNKEMSFFIMNIFIATVAEQLRRFGLCWYFKPSYITKAFKAKGIMQLRSNVVNLLIQSAADFASRSVVSCKKSQTASIAAGSNFALLDELMLERMQSMVRWEDTNHLMVLFHSPDKQTVSAIYRNLEHVPENIRRMFATQLGGPLPDMVQMNHNELHELLLNLVCVGNCLQDKQTANVNVRYALTPDNVLKMVLISTRIHAHVPVIMMGETGCGKTTLIMYLAQVCNAQFEALNIHAGVTRKELIEKLTQWVAMAMSNLKQNLWIFLDEINTCDHLGLLADLICHQMFMGKHLPPNLIILAACNPYRLRSEEEQKTAGIDDKLKPDEYSKLAYRVNPLPENMMDFVWDYGSLGKNDEMMYINRMVLNSNEPSCSLNLNLITELLFESQCCLRRIECNNHCVSLRDIYRANCLHSFFTEMCTELNLSKKLSSNLMPYLPIILSLTHCYLVRIQKEGSRADYVKSLLLKFASHRTYVTEVEFKNLIANAQDYILDTMQIPNGIAKNTALRENIFVMTICILNKIPVFLVGKPGSSKSLSMQIIRSSLRGRDSKHEYLKKKPQLYVVSFQGSETSTSDGIRKVFDKAMKYHKRLDEALTLPVVLLDEVGLAEVSRFKPLKVLHALLEPPGHGFPDIAVVGISNWALDAAKMNRAIHLSRTDPSVDELYDTAISLAKDVVGVDTELLNSLAVSFFNYWKNQKRKNFHGLRDYYSLVKYIVREKKSMSSISDIVLRGVLRNFNGVSDCTEAALNSFRCCFDEKFKLHQQTQCLLKENLQDVTARHLLIISNGETALGILLNLLKEINREHVILYGSTFVEDKVDEYNYRILNKIILYMELDIVLILKDLDSVYGSLYDLLNQNYTKVGQKQHCRIALGPYSNPMCCVNERFRCVVMMEEKNCPLADPPFLNRFEKQFISLSNVLSNEEDFMLTKLKNWCLELISHKLKVHEDSVNILSSLLAADSDNLLSSLALKMSVTHKDNQDDWFLKARRRLLYLMPPEGMLRAINSTSAKHDWQDFQKVLEAYFTLPLFEGLSKFCHVFFKQPEELQNDDFITDGCTRTVILTHSAPTTSLKYTLGSYGTLREGYLETYKTHRELEKQLDQFWTDLEETILIIHCCWPKDGQHFFMAKALMDEFAAKHSKSWYHESKHMFLIVHIDRNLSTNKPPCTFLWNWNLVFLDPLILSDNRPTVPSYVQKDLSSLLMCCIEENIRLIDIIICELLPGTFTQIKYMPSHIRNLDDIMEILVNLPKKKQILQCIGSHIIDSLPVKLKTLSTFEHNWLVKLCYDQTVFMSTNTLHDAAQQHMNNIIQQELYLIVCVFEKFSAWPKSLSSLCTENVTNCEVNLWHSEWQRRKTKIEQFICMEPVIPLTCLLSKFISSDLYICKSLFLEEISHIGCSSNIATLGNNLYIKVYGNLENQIAAYFNDKIELSDHLQSHIDAYISDILNMTFFNITGVLDSSLWLRMLQLLLRGKAKFQTTCIPFHLPSLLAIVHGTIWESEKLFQDMFNFFALFVKLKLLSEEEIYSVVSELEQSSKYLYLKCYEADKKSQVVLPLDGKCTEFHTKEHSSVLISVSSNQNDEFEKMSNMFVKTTFTVLQADTDQVFKSNSEFNENQDFEHKILTCSLALLLNADKWKHGHCKKHLGLALAAAKRLNQNHPLIEFLNVMLDLICIENLANLNAEILRQIFQAAAEIEKPLSDKKIIDLICQSVLSEKVDEIRSILLAFGSILDADPNDADMPFLEHLVEKSIEFASRPDCTVYLRPILFRLYNAYAFTDDRHLQELLYSEGNVVDYQDDILNIENWFSNCQIRNELWMLSLQILEKESFQNFTANSLKAIESVEAPELKLFKNALSILAVVEDMTFQKLVAIRYIRAFLSAVVINTSSLAKLEAGTYNFLFREISACFSPFTPSSGTASGNAKEVVLVYLLKEFSKEIDNLDEIMIFMSKLRELMPCLTSMQIFYNNANRLPWYPICISSSYNDFLCDIQSLNFDDQSSKKVHFNNGSNNFLHLLSNKVHANNESSNFLLSDNNYGNQEFDSASESSSDEYYEANDFCYRPCEMPTSKYCIRDIFNFFTIKLLNGQSSENDANLIQHIIDNLNPVSSLTQLVMLNIFKNNTNIAFLNITTDTPYDSVLQILVIIDLIKLCCILQNDKVFNSISLFAQCIDDVNIIMLDIESLNSTTAFFQLCKCSSRICSMKGLKQCPLCSKLFDHTKCNNESRSWKRQAVKTIVHEFFKLLVAAAKLAGMMLRNKLVDDSTDCYVDFVLAWTTVVNYFPERKDWVCKFIHIILEKLTDSTCLSEFPTKASSEKLMSWYSNFENILVPLINKRHVTVHNAEIEKMHTLQNDFNSWQARCMEIDNLNPTGMLQNMFTILAKPNLNHFKQSYILLCDEKTYPFLDLFFRWKNKLELLKLILPLWSWHKAVITLYSHHFSRKEASTYTIQQALLQHSHLTKVFDAAVASLLRAEKYFSLLPNLNFRFFKEAATFSETIIIDAQSNLFVVLQQLVQIQNEFLDELAVISLENDENVFQYVKWNTEVAIVPTLHFLYLTDNDIISYELSENFLHFCKNNTDYGCGSEIQYDYKTIESEMAYKMLFAKPFIIFDSTIPVLLLKDEQLQISMQNLLLETVLKFQQTPLNQEQKRFIQNQFEENRARCKGQQELLRQIMWCLKMSDNQNEEPLSSFVKRRQIFMHIITDEYMQSWGDMFCVNHLVSTYLHFELLLGKQACEQNSENKFDMQLTSLKEDIHMTLKTVPSIPLQTLLETLYRLFFRSGISYYIAL